MPNANESYASYLLRFRRLSGDKGRTWVASIQCTATGELRRFPNLEALVQFLRDEFGDGQETQDASPAVERTGIAARSEPGARGAGRSLNRPQRRG
jgi:hypothetical protein